jgi:hypothetical protein
MINKSAHADNHLKLLAQELHSYGTLECRIVEPANGPLHLRVASKDAPWLTEFITCEATATCGTVAYRWSWGHEIVGATLTDKARSIADLFRPIRAEDDFRR